MRKVFVPAQEKSWSIYADQHDEPTCDQLMQAQYPNAVNTLMIQDPSSPSGYSCIWNDTSEGGMDLIQSGGVEKAIGTSITKIVPRQSATPARSATATSSLTIPVLAVAGVSLAALILYFAMRK